MGLERVDNAYTGRTYIWGNESYPSVTTLLDQIHKPALVPWAAKVVAEKAADREYPVSEKDKRLVVSMLKSLPDITRQEAADRGTAVHKALEVGNGLRKPHLAEALKTPPTCNDAFIDACVAHGYEFLRNNVKEVVACEARFLNTDMGYAGSGDLVYKSLSGQLILADYKTGKGVYPESVVPQLFAYAMCDLWLTDGKTELKTPSFDKVEVVHLRDTGYKVYSWDVTQRQWDKVRRMLKACKVLWMYKVDPQWKLKLRDSGKAE